MLAAVSAIFPIGHLIGGRGVIFYVENRNARSALVNGTSDTVVIRKMIQLFRKVAQDQAISVWCELSPSGVNISDLPTRHSPPPFLRMEHRPMVC